MPRTKRSFTPEQRLSLIQEAEREGYMETCRKYNLSPTLLSSWKWFQKFARHCIDKNDEMPLAVFVTELSVAALAFTVLSVIIQKIL